MTHLLNRAPLSLMLRMPVATVRGPMLERRGFIISLEAEGLRGLGESTPMPSFGTESLEAAAAAFDAFRLDALPGSVDDVERLTTPLAATPAARFGVESALLDWLSQSRGVPVAALLKPAGEPLAQVEVNALVEGTDAVQLARSAAAAVERGFRVVKVKVGARPLAVDAQRLLAVRRAIGPQAKLRVDANGAWTEGTARSALRGLESLALELCEQPVAAGDVEGLRRLRWHVPVPLAADESLLLPSLTPRLLAEDPRPAADVLVLKPMALGGLVPALRLAARALEVGVSSYVTTLIDGPLARAAAAHLAAALPGSSHAHGLATVELLEGVAPDAYTPVRGFIRLPGTPGWGLSL